MKCVVCEEKLDNAVQHSFCPTCGFPVFRVLDKDPSTQNNIKKAAARCRDAWIGNAKLWVVVHKYRKTPDGLVSVSEDKVPIASCRDLRNNEIYWLPQSFASIRTNSRINIDLKVRNGEKKCRVSVPIVPPAASGSWHIGFTQESPGYLRMHLDDGSRCVRSGRISIHEAGLKPGDPGKPVN